MNLLDCRMGNKMLGSKKHLSSHMEITLKKTSAWATCWRKHAENTLNKKYKGFLGRKETIVSNLVKPVIFIIRGKIDPNLLKLLLKAVKNLGLINPVAWPFLINTKSLQLVQIQSEESDSIFLKLHSCKWTWLPKMVLIFSDLSREVGKNNSKQWKPKEGSNLRGNQAKIPKCKINYC